MQCPEYALQCNKSVHLPAWVTSLCLLGNLWVIWAPFALRALWVILLYIEEGKVVNPVSTGSISAAENLDQFEPRRFFHQIPVLWLISNICEAHSTDFIEVSGHKSRISNPTGRVCFITCGEEAAWRMMHTERS